MQKTKVMCLILALVLATAGTAGVLVNMSGDTGAPVIPDNALNKILDKPSEGTPSDCSAIENLYIAQGELQRKGGFVGQTRGTTTSAGISQTVINNRTVINGNVFKEMITIGAVKNAYQLYMYGDNYLYRGFDSIKSADNINWADNAQKYAQDDFLAKFGHRSDSLTGYILNDDTIVEGNLEKEENGLYTYRYILNIDTAPARMLYEMRANSNMNGFSTFTKAEIIVTMDADWQVKTLTTDCKYKVPLFGGLACTEDITETFSDLTSEDLPEKEFFEQFFNAEITAPVDSQPDALNVLMDIFSPYIEGNNLNVALNAEMDGQTVLNGLVSAKIDIENIENIEVAAKLGDDLFVEYQHGSLFVTYQDFKASTTVDGIMGVVGALMPQTNGLDFDADDLLDKFTYQIVNNVCTVNLPISLGEDVANVNIYANVDDGKYEFTHAEAMLGSINLRIEPTGAFEVPARSGEYPEILGLLDLVQNGVIYGNVNAFDMDLDVMLDLATMSLVARGSDLLVNYVDETIYVEYGAIKVKLGLDDLDGLMTMLRFSGIIDQAGMPAMPELSVSTVLGMLSNITAASTDNGTVFALSLDDINVALYLVVTANGWSADKITLDMNGISVTLAVSEPWDNDEPEINGDDYADVADMISAFINPVACLLTANSYGASFDFAIDVNGAKYNVNGSFACDSAKNINIKATISNDAAKLIDADATVVDGIAYLQINGIKVAFALGDMALDIDLSEIISELYGVNDETDSLIDFVGGIVNTVKNIDLANIDFAGIVKEFSFDNDALALTVDAGFVGLNDISLQLSSQGNNLVLSIDGLQLANVAIDAQATVRPYAAKINVPNVSDYVLNLAGTVNDDISFIVSADLLSLDVSAQINALNQTVLVRYFNGKVYAKIGEVAIVASVDELAQFVSEIMSQLGAETTTSVDMSSFANIDLSLDTILSALTLDLNGALCIGLQLDNVASVKVNFNNNAELVGITASVSGLDITLEQTTETVPQIDITPDYVDIADVAQNFASQIMSLVNAAGYSITLNGTFNFDGNVYGVKASVEYNNGLYVNANVTYANNAFVNLQLWYVDGIVYAQLGDIRFAMNVNAIGKTVDAGSSFNMSALKGYNPCVDSILELVENAIGKFNSNEIDFAALVSGLTYNDGVLSVAIDGSQLGLSKFTLNLTKTNGIEVVIDNLASSRFAADITVSVAERNAAVAAPKGDFTTNLAIKLDEANTIYANIDLLNGVFNFRLDDMYMMYANNVIKVKKGDLYLTGDIDAIMKYVYEIDELVNAFSGATESTMAKIDFNKFKNIDVKAIIDSLSISALGSNSVSLGVNIFDIDVNAVLRNGELSYIAAPLNIIGKSLDIRISPSNEYDYANFDGDIEFIAIEKVFYDYMPSIRALVHTNSWKFSFVEDGYIGITFNNESYRVTNNSYVEFYYKNTEGLDTMTLRAYVDVQKMGVDGKYKTWMSLDAVYIPFTKNADGSINWNKDIYITYTGDHGASLKFTLSVNSIMNCLSLKDGLIEVVPQIGDILDKINSTKDEALGNAQNLKLSKILQGAFYNGGVFGLTLNGSPLISKLGEIALVARAENGSLVLQQLQIEYEGISVRIEGLRVAASEVVADYTEENASQWQYGSQYVTVQHIAEYNTSEYHIDLNSIYSLLSSFVDTAGDYETVVRDDGTLGRVRSFYISGEVKVAIAIGKLNFADLPIGVDLRVDINEDNQVYIAAKLSRGNDKVMGMNAYGDNGGDGYIYFNGEDNTFAVLRNSRYEYCTKSGQYGCSKWHTHSNVLKDDLERYGKLSVNDVGLSTEEFTAKIMDYIFLLINLNPEKQILLLGNSIEGLVKDNIQNSNSSEFSIEDVFKDYSYSETAGDYKVQLDLQPIDKNLTSATLDIFHGKDGDYKLTALSGELKLLKGLCTVTLDLGLEDSKYNVAKRMVETLELW